MTLIIQLPNLDYNCQLYITSPYICVTEIFEGAPYLTMCKDNIMIENKAVSGNSLKFSFNRKC